VRPGAIEAVAAPVLLDDDYHLAVGAVLIHRLVSERECIPSAELGYKRALS
jgi:hypothetical protein